MSRCCFPAALENVITDRNAGKIRCKISCELANGPTTPEADDILSKNNIFVLPDFLANAGGVTVSYFEQVQNTYNFYWPLEEVHQRLDEKMTRAFHGVYKVYLQREGEHEAGGLSRCRGKGGRSLQIARLGIVFSLIRNHQRGEGKGDRTRPPPPFSRKRLSPSFSP